MRDKGADPVARWQAISAWYADFALEQGWEFLLPMVDLTDWISRQTFAADLYPSTSHQWLCVSLAPNDLESPIFSCCARPDGLFEFGHDNLGVRNDGKELYPAADAQKAFVSFARRLTGISSENF